MDDDEREYGSSENEQDELMEDADDVEADNDAEEDNEEEEEEQDEQDEPDADPDPEPEPEPEPGADADQNESQAPGPDGQTTDTADDGRTAKAASAVPSTPGASQWRPKLRQEYLNAPLYEIVPTMAAPMATSVNAIAITPDLRYWMTGGSDGFIRKYDGMATINGKQPLTVAQKHPFVESVIKAGVCMSYWENEEPLGPGARAEDVKVGTPVYSLAVHSKALWMLSGLGSGGINLYSVRHDEGKRIHCLREGGHTNAVSVLQLASDEKSVLSGSWDKLMLDWDLNNGHVIRRFEGSGGQISAIELRPTNGAPIPAEASDPEIKTDTFESNDAKAPVGTFYPNGAAGDIGTAPVGDDTATAASPEHESLFGSPAGSLFGDTDTMGGGNAFGNDDDDGFMDMGTADEHPGAFPMGDADVPDPEPTSGQAAQPEAGAQNGAAAGGPDTAMDLDQPSTAPQQVVPPSGPDQGTQSQDQDANEAPNSSNPAPSSPAMIFKSAAAQPDQDPTQSSTSTFLSAAIDGTIRIWDRRVPDPVARIGTRRGVPPWCMSACWSPDGNWIYAGRRNGTVEEFNVHKARSGWQPERSLKFPGGSGAVSCVRPMVNGRHLVCASHDILRLYDLRENAAFKHSKVPFVIIPGPPRAGVISALYIDPTSRIMISAHGTRGWDGTSTEGIIGYEIGVAKA
ncbi:SPT8-like protein [Apodospora peruviana]|uniref:SPT8-like protein n=1 Tax=Apodospora peruviana TaxID=516989 RepID=A0AAE0ITG9_9PEZI|nr:SPT8-like protein [Apodospora peruviana]